MLTRTDFISRIAAASVASVYPTRAFGPRGVAPPRTFEGHKLPLYWCALRAKVFGELRFPASYYNATIERAELERSNVLEAPSFPHRYSELVEASERLGVDLRYETWEQLREDALRAGLCLGFYVHVPHDSGPFSKWSTWIESYASAYPVAKRDSFLLNTINAAEGGNACALDWLCRTGVWERLSAAIVTGDRRTLRKPETSDASLSTQGTKRSIRGGTPSTGSAHDKRLSLGHGSIRT